MPLIFSEVHWSCQEQTYLTVIKHLDWGELLKSYLCVRSYWQLIAAVLRRSLFFSGMWALRGYHIPTSIINTEAKQTELSMYFLKLNQYMKVERKSSRGLMNWKG